MRISTHVVLDMETGAELFRDGYDYAGPVALCKASSDEKQISAEQNSFYSSLLQSYRQQFAGQSGILSSIQNAFQPLLSAGPNQTGFSADELASMRAQATDEISNNYRSAAAAIREREGAMGGGNNYLPNGGSAQVDAQLAAQAAQANANAQNQITAADYEAGRQNFSQALAALSGAAGLYNPEGFITGANSAGSEAFGSASDVAKQNAGAWSSIGKGIGSVAGALGGFMIGGPGGAQLGSSLGGTLGGDLGGAL